MVSFLIAFCFVMYVSMSVAECIKPQWYLDMEKDRYERRMNSSVTYIIATRTIGFVLFILPIYGRALGWW